MMDLSALIQACAPNVAPTTMMKIISVETASRVYAIGYKITKAGRTYTLARQPQNRDEALSWASWLHRGGYRFDIGITQLNSMHFARLGLTPISAFDPCTNVAAGARVLTEAYERAARKYGPGQQALRYAISAYNTGNFSSGFTNGYVSKVVNADISRFHAKPIFR